MAAPRRLFGRTPDVRERFPDLHAFCLFVGHGRSGHSLVGALLDAHPDMVVAHEANALRLVSEGMSRDVLFETLLENSRRSYERGRRQSGYSYLVDGGWQGRFRILRVLGDKCGGRTTKLIARIGLRSFARHVGLPVRIVHVLRNPYDTIARQSLVLRDGVPKRTIAQAVEEYAVMTETAAQTIADGRYPALTVRHESLIDDPRLELLRLCEFMQVEPDPAYLDACAAILYSSPSRTRERTEWTEAEREAVAAIVARYDFLDGYGWDS